MSKILEELAYIFEWLEYMKPGLSDCYHPGLSRQQIDKILKDLPFKLSEEVYDLYRWRNGFNFDTDVASTATFLFVEQLKNDVSLAFCSLQDSIYIYNAMRSESQNGEQDDGNEYWNDKWFPIAAFETKRMLYVVGDMEPSPVYLWDVDYFDRDYVRAYKSLTNMISVIAECCESDVYELAPYEYGDEGEVMIQVDKNKFDIEKAIYQKYTIESAL